MATVIESNQCSKCNKPSTKYFCIGCKQYFCPKDFKEHEQQLLIKFDDEVVRLHDEILDQIHKLEQSNYLSLASFDDIEQWKKKTINKVELAATKAHNQLVEHFNKQRVTMTKQLEPITAEIRNRQEEENFLEYDIDRLKEQINELRKRLASFLENDSSKPLIVFNDKINWDQIIHIQEYQENLSPQCSANILVNMEWMRHGIIVAGGNRQGNRMDQLVNPWGLCIDDDQTVYIADCGNHRIVEWKLNATIGRLVTDSIMKGQHLNLRWPTDVIFDRKKDSLIVCDYGNKRVVRWPRQNDREVEVIMSNVGCYGLTMDYNGFLYVVDSDKNEVRQFSFEESKEILVAGGNGRGSELNQLNSPRYVFVDQDQSVYVSDECNHRVMKWTKGAKEGIIVAGGQGSGSSVKQLSSPCGIIVDQSGYIYVADRGNNRIMRWCQNETDGTSVIGENSEGNRSEHLFSPTCVSLDGEGNLYVSQYHDHQVKKFKINRS